MERRIFVFIKKGSIFAVELRGNELPRGQKSPILLSTMRL